MHYRLSIRIYILITRLFHLGTLVVGDVYVLMRPTREATSAFPARFARPAAAIILLFSPMELYVKRIRDISSVTHLILLLILIRIITANIDIRSTNAILLRIYI